MSERLLQYPFGMKDGIEGAISGTEDICIWEFNFIPALDPDSGDNTDLSDHGDDVSARSIKCPFRAFATSIRDPPCLPPTRKS